MMSKFIIEECLNFDQWNNFVDESNQGTIYSRNDFICAIFPNSKFFFVKNAHEVLGAVSLLIDSENNVVKKPSYFPYYNSILFNPNRDSLTHKRIKLEFSITELILSELVGEFKEFSCSQAPSFNDIRPFQWYNFHNKSEGYFESSTSYTPVLNLKNIDLTTVVNNLRYDRRKEYKSEKSELTVESSKDLGCLSELHQLTFERQGITRLASDVEIFNKIGTSCLERGHAELLICRFEGIAIAANLFLFDNKRSYYQFGAQHAEYRKFPGATKTMLKAIDNSIKRCLLEVDFVGANSPFRSDYKLSYNCDLKHHYLNNFVFGENKKVQ